MDDDEQFKGLTLAEIEELIGSFTDAQMRMIRRAGADPERVDTRMASYPFQAKDAENPEFFDCPVIEWEGARRMIMPNGDLISVTQQDGDEPETHWIMSFGGQPDPSRRRPALRLVK